MSHYVYVEPDPDRRVTVGALYSDFGFAIVPELAELETHLTRNPETLLVVLGAEVDLDAALTFAAYQRVQRPVLGVLLLRHQLDPEVLGRAMRSGVREVIEGVLARHAFADGRARYETAEGAHHDHLIDIESGRVIEFQSPEIEQLQHEIARRLGFKIVSHRLEIYARPLRGRGRKG